MIRIIRSAILTSLRSDAAATAAARQEVADHVAEAQTWHTRYDEIHAAYEQTFKDLGQAHADRIQAERGRNEARAQREQDKAATDQEMSALQNEYRRIRDAAAAPETGESVRAAIALNVLKDLYTNARTQGLDTSGLDLVAFVCGFGNTPQPQAPAALTA